MQSLSPGDPEGRVSGVPPAKRVLSFPGSVVRSDGGLWSRAAAATPGQGPSRDAGSLMGTTAQQLTVCVALTQDGTRGAHTPSRGNRKSFFSSEDWLNFPWRVHSEKAGWFLSILV